MSPDGEQALEGGFSHPGKVVRAGDTVRRPVNPYRDATNPLLDHISRMGEIEIPRPLGLDDRGRETFSFIEGDVPVPPYPFWATTDEALHEVGSLLRRYHEAARSWPVPAEAKWPADLADPEGGSIVCHNDVCLENVVFREGRAVGLVDFDLAAPGRPIYDVAQTLRLCGPARDPGSIQPSFLGVDPIERVRIFGRGYRLDPAGARELVSALLDACRVATRFVKARAEEGRPWFAERWAEGGPERYAADERWVIDHANEIVRAAAG